MYTAVDVEGRIRIAVFWHDDLDRVTDTVRYGTYGGSDFDRKPSGSWLAVPARSDTALLTEHTYNDDGSLKEVTDPMARVTRYEYDDAGRQTKVIANYVDGTPSGDTDQTVVYAYTDGLRTTITADMPAGTDDQVSTGTQD